MQYWFPDGFIYHIPFVLLNLSASSISPFCGAYVLRSSSLSAVNAMLREQLEQAGLANEALSQDIRRLTADWTKAREELEQKESDWRREEEVRADAVHMGKIKSSKKVCVHYFHFILYFSLSTVTSAVSTAGC